MNKILLVYEDYAEMMTIESALKKVGFDVMSLSNEYLVGDQIVAFNPDLVVTYGKGGKVNTLSVGKRLKEMPRWQGKAVLIFAPGVKPQPQDLLKIRVDMVLEAPISMLRLFQVIAKLLDKDESLLTERLDRSMGESTEDVSVSVGNRTLEGGNLLVRGEDEPREHDTSASRFKFGDRMSSPESSSEGRNESEELFSEVDLSSLEEELLGPQESKPKFNLMERDDDARSSESPQSGQAPEAAAPKNPKSFTLKAPEDAPESLVESEGETLKKKAQASLRQAQEDLKKKASRYSEVAANTPLAKGKGTVSRIASRKAQKEIAADWKAEELQNQDQMRQAFAKAMFKK